MSVALSYEKTTEILGAVKIPAAPAAFMELHELMQHDEPDIDAVSATISKDVGLAVLVLKTVNSPFFGLRADVKSIRQATVLLGLVNVSNIVAGLALRRAMEEEGGAAPEHYWETPANIGKVAARLAQQFGGASPDEAYMLGLFHHVGVPLMMQRFPDYPVLIQEARREGSDLMALEESRYQTHHAVVGYFVSKSWGLPEHMGELIQRHHEISATLSEADGRQSREGILLCVLKMAEHIDQRFWGKIDDPEWLGCRDEVLAYVGMSTGDFEDIADDMLELLSQQ